MSEPWAYIAHKDGSWRGVLSARLPKRNLHHSLGKYVADGCTIITTYSREEYLAELSKLDAFEPSAAETRDG